LACTLPNYCSYSLCSGGKAGAATISTDEDFTVLVGAIRRKPMHTSVGISFDLDSIAMFKIWMKRVTASVLIRAYNF
jgi:hypothetical protein